MKDIVGETQKLGEAAPKLGTLLREQIYAQDANARFFVSGWVAHVSGDPAAGIADCLPAIVHGLFQEFVRKRDSF